MTRDPIDFTAGSANLYEYVGSNPTNRVDPFGLCRVPTETYSQCWIRELSDSAFDTRIVASAKQACDYLLLIPGKGEAAFLACMIVALSQEAGWDVGTLVRVTWVCRFVCDPPQPISRLHCNCECQEFEIPPKCGKKVQLGKFFTRTSCVRACGNLGMTFCWCYYDPEDLLEMGIRPAKPCGGVVDVPLR